MSRYPETSTDIDIGATQFGKVNDFNCLGKFLTLSKNI